ncbi:MAG: hypothetical protein HY053_04205 [Proteobacteria bacterium]|nr:hypothetical protein [Pseudomonadota bacterium]
MSMPSQNKPFKAACDEWFRAAEELLELYKEYDPETVKPDFAIQMHTTDLKMARAKDKMLLVFLATNERAFKRLQATTPAAEIENISIWLEQTRAAIRTSVPANELGHKENERVLEEKRRLPPAQQAAWSALIIRNLSNLSKSKKIYEEYAFAGKTLSEGLGMPEYAARFEETCKALYESVVLIHQKHARNIVLKSKDNPVRAAFEQWVLAADEIVGTLSAYDPKTLESDFGIRLRMNLIIWEKTRSELILAFAAPKVRESLEAGMWVKELAYASTESEIERIKKSSPAEQAAWTAQTVKTMVMEISQDQLGKHLGEFVDFGRSVAKQPGMEGCDEVIHHRCEAFYSAVLAMVQKHQALSLQ